MTDLHHLELPDLNKKSSPASLEPARYHQGSSISKEQAVRRSQSSIEQRGSTAANPGGVPA
jgi:hypothetical protein